MTRRANSSCWAWDFATSTIDFSTSRISLKTHRWGMKLFIRSHRSRALMFFRSSCSRLTVCMRLAFRQKNRFECRWSTQSWSHRCIVHKSRSFRLFSRSILAIRRYRCRAWPTSCDRIRRSCRIYTISSSWISTIQCITTLIQLDSTSRIITMH